MREIAFRAWGIDGAKGPRMWDWNHIMHAFDVWLADSTAVLMQYTGIKDKNGKEIYEGDIVLTDEAGWKGVVTWCNAGFLLLNEGFCSDTKAWIEVVGDIYQTPELLQEKSK